MDREKRNKEIVWKDQRRMLIDGSFPISITAHGVKHILINYIIIYNLLNIHEDNALRRPIQRRSVR